MNARDLLPAITELSREFGAGAYVRGGGGNASCKDDDTLLIKPSGTTLADMTPEKFIGISRGKLDKLYTTPFPEDVNGREQAVLAFVSEAVLHGATGRPSVETPLHNCFPQRFVIHTHPAAVNGLTCGAEGEKACRRLFPDALWMPVTEPGYILSMRVREAMERYRAANGRSPEMLLLENHGLFIAHDDADGVRALHRRALEAVGAVIEKAGLAGPPEQGAAPEDATVQTVADAVRPLLGEDAAFVAAGGRFPIPTGALTPDHIVYCRSYMYDGDADAASLAAFRELRGYWPRVVATPAGVFGFGATQKIADLALELARDGAMVVRCAGAFGGVQYLDRHFVDFIENWEVESYRRKLAT